MERPKVWRDQGIYICVNKNKYWRVARTTQVVSTRERKASRDLHSCTSFRPCPSLFFYFFLFFLDKPYALEIFSLAFSIHDK
jgi:hypothetical protein